MRDSDKMLGDVHRVLALVLSGGESDDVFIRNEFEKPVWADDDKFVRGS